MAAKNVCTLLLHMLQPCIGFTVDFEILQLKTLVLRQAFSSKHRLCIHLYVYTYVCEWCVLAHCFCSVKRFVQYKKYRLSSSSEIKPLCTEKSCHMFSLQILKQANQNKTMHATSMARNSSPIYLPSSSASFFPVNHPQS